MRRDTERVRAKSAANIPTPTPDMSEMPTLDGGLSPSAYSTMYAPIVRIISGLTHVRVHRVAAILTSILTVLVALGCTSNEPTPSADAPVAARTVVVVERIVVTATPLPPTATPRPTPEPSVCVLDSQLKMAAAGQKVSCVTPTPMPEHLQYCHDAADEIELLAQGKHPEQHKYRLFAPPDTKIGEIRVGEESHMCFGVARAKHMRPARITFSKGFFRHWDKSRDGAWE